MRGCVTLCWNGSVISRMSDKFEQCFLLQLLREAQHMLLRPLIWNALSDFGVNILCQTWGFEWHLHFRVGHMLVQDYMHSEWTVACNISENVEKSVNSSLWTVNLNSIWNILFNESMVYFFLTWILWY